MFYCKLSEVPLEHSLIFPQSPTTNTGDHIQQYAWEVLTLGLLWSGMGFGSYDAGVLFKATKRKNYSI